MASLYRVVFSENNTLSTIGSYRIMSFVDPFKYFTGITSITDEITRETDSYHVQRSFRWSRDSANWSLWINYTPDNVSPSNMGGITSLVFDQDEYLYIEFKFTVVSTASPELALGTAISPDIVIEEIDFIPTKVLPDPYLNYTGPVRGLCSNEYLIKPVLFQESQFTFNPYNINQGLNLYQDLSNMVNSVFGFMAVYYRIVPQWRSKDVVLKEWTIFQVEQEQCMKILVPNNQFPDNKPYYNGFGIDFEQPFEVHIDRKYWESFFGKNTMPQQRDVIYFPDYNRIYEVQSSYVYRDFMNQPLYFKVALTKYQPRMDTIVPTDIATTLDNITISTEELFGDDFVEQVERHTKPQQYVTIAYDSDPIREQVMRNIVINAYKFYNNYLLVFDNYYNLAEIFDGTNEVAVSYRIDSKITSTENRSFICWFSPQANQQNSSTTRPLLSGRNTAGSGIDIDLNYATSSSQIVLSINSDVYTFTLQQNLTVNQWYALVVNWSSEFKQASVDVWTTQIKTSQLKRISHESMTVNAFSYDTGVRYSLKTSPLFLTNIRIFDSMLEEENQNIVLNQIVIKDSQKALVIDNAKPLIKLPKIANPK